MLGIDLTTGARSSSVFLDRDRRLRLIWRILLAWLGFFGAVLIIGSALQAATGWLPATISHTVTGVGVTASALGLVFLLRRHVDRRPWSGIGLTLDRAAIPHLLIGATLTIAIQQWRAATARGRTGRSDRLYRGSPR